MLKCEHISVTLGNNTILRDISFHLKPGSFTALVGKNGSGKSTLASCLRSQLPYSGAITLDGQNIRSIPRRALAQRIASLPQAVPCPEVTVEELAGFGRNPYLGLNRRFSDADKAAVANALRRTQMDAFSQRYLSSLSGGERQRAFLAMVLAQETDILVLDEPTTYLDIGAEAAFIRLLSQLPREGKTLLVILHNLSLAVKYANDLIVLDGGRCRFSGTKEDCLTQGVLEDVFDARRVVTPDGDILFTAK